MRPPNLPKQKADCKSGMIPEQDISDISLEENGQEILPRKQNQGLIKEFHCQSIIFKQLPPTRIHHCMYQWLFFVSNWKFLM